MTGEISRNIQTNKKTASDKQAVPTGVNENVAGKISFPAIPDNWIKWIVFFASFLVYIISLAPDFTFEDSPELIAAAFQLGVPHPPGYPLYCILGKIFTFLPFGSISYRVNLMSAFFGALTIFFLYRCAEFIFKNYFLSITAVLIFAFSTTFWNISTVAEVYSLNSFFVFLLFYILLEWKEQPDRKKLPYIFSLVFGLSVTNHQTILFLTPVFLFMFFKIDKSFFGKPAIILPFLLGLSLYLYLPIAASHSPYMNWSNPSNFEQFKNTITRAQYGTLPSMSRPVSEFMKQLSTFNPNYEFLTKEPANIVEGNFELNDWLLFLFFITIVAAGIINIKDKFLKYTTAGIFFFYSIFTIYLMNTPTSKLFTYKVFFIPAWAIFSIWLVKGIEYFLERFKFPSNRYFMILLLPLLLVFTRFDKLDSHNYSYATDYSRNVLKSLKKDAILFTIKDNETFPLWNVQSVEFLREDVAIINIITLSELWYAKQVKERYPNVNVNLDVRQNIEGALTKEKIRNAMVQNIIQDNPGKPAYISNNENEQVKLTYKLFGNGVVYEISPQGKDIEVKDFSYYFAFNGIFNPNHDTMTKMVLQSYANNFFSSGNYFYERKDYETALKYFFLSSDFNKSIGFDINNVYNYKNIGVIYYNNKNIAGAIEYWQYAVNLQPNTQFATELRGLINGLTGQGQKPDDVSRKAEELYNAGNYNEAIKYYLKSLEKSQKNPRTYSNIGDCYFNMNNVDEALKYYELAINLDRNYINAYYNLGGCYYTKRDVKNARRIWLQGYRIDPTNNLLKQILDKTGGLPK